MRRTRMGISTNGRPNAVRPGSLRGTPAAGLSVGASEAVRPGDNSGDMASGRTMARRTGSSPGEALSRGATLAARPGQSPAGSLARGAPRFAKGGYLGFEKPMERFELGKERNKKLGTPHYAGGGSLQDGMRNLYNVLHSHFEKMPPMKKLGATKQDVSDGVPHNYPVKKKGGAIAKRGFHRPQGR